MKKKDVLELVSGMLKPLQQEIVKCKSDTTNEKLAAEMVKLEASFEKLKNDIKTGFEELKEERNRCARSELAQITSDHNKFEKAKELGYDVVPRWDQMRETPLEDVNEPNNN